MSSMILPLTGFRTRATSLFRDYAELTKLRVTSLIVMTAWCGYFFGAHKAGESWLSFGLLHALLGIGLVSSGTAALNEVMEHDVDGHMRRTALRPIPAGRMSLAHAMIVGLLMSIGGSFYLAIFTNPLTGLLTFLTSVVYLVAYTPLKRVSPICTFVGAFPGAMPGVLGWTAVRGSWNGELWSCSPSFSCGSSRTFSRSHGYIVRIMRKVESRCCRSWKRTDARRPAAFSSIRLLSSQSAFCPVSWAWRERFIWWEHWSWDSPCFTSGFALPSSTFLWLAARSKMRARHVLQASVIYLPLLFALMMGNSVRP